jgi:hypothetical protein
VESGGYCGGWGGEMKAEREYQDEQRLYVVEMTLRDELLMERITRGEPVPLNVIKDLIKRLFQQVDGVGGLSDEVHQMMETYQLFKHTIKKGHCKVCGKKVVNRIYCSLKCKQKGRKYNSNKYQEHREKYIQRSKKYYQEHREDRLEYNKIYGMIYYEKHREERKAKALAYYHANKEKNHHKRRAYYVAKKQQAQALIQNETTPEQL